MTAWSCHPLRPRPKNVHVLRGVRGLKGWGGKGVLGWGGGGWVGRGGGYLTHLVLRFLMTITFKCYNKITKTMEKIKPGWKCVSVHSNESNKIWNEIVLNLQMDISKLMINVHWLTVIETVQVCRVLLKQCRWVIETVQVCRVLLKQCRCAECYWNSAGVQSVI